MKVNIKTYRVKLHKKAAVIGISILLAATALSATALASEFNIGYNTNASDNDYIFTTKAPRGRIGKSMSISFRIRATDEDMKNLKVSLLETNDFQMIEERGNGDYTVDYYPFEIIETTFVPKSVGISKRAIPRAYPSLPMCAETRNRDITVFPSIWNGMGATTLIILISGSPQTPPPTRMMRRIRRKATILSSARTSPPPEGVSQRAGLHCEFQKPPFHHSSGCDRSHGTL